MKPIVDSMRKIGANDMTVNLMLVYLMSFLFVIGIGLMSIIIIDVAIKGIQPQPWVIGSFTALLGIVTTLLAVNHGVQSVNNVQSRTVAEQHVTTQPVIEAQSQTSIINAQTIQQVLAAMALVNQTNANNVSTTTSTLPQQATPMQETIEDNTKATKENTNITLMETINRAGNMVTSNKEKGVS